MTYSHVSLTFIVIHIPSSLSYKTHYSRKLNCWSLRCSWSIACQHCSNYIFILHWTLGFIILPKDNCKSRWETFKSRDLVKLILVILRYLTVVHIISLVTYCIHYEHYLFQITIWINMHPMHGINLSTPVSFAWYSPPTHSPFPCDLGLSQLDLMKVEAKLSAAWQMSDRWSFTLAMV